MIAQTCHAGIHGCIFVTRQVQQAINVCGVEQKNGFHYRRGNDLFGIGNQNTQKRHIENHHKKQPYADGDTGGGTAFFDFCADQITHRQKGCTKNHAGNNQEGKRFPCGKVKAAVGKLEGNACQSVACRGGKSKDDEMADKFTGKDLVARNRIAQQQRHRAAFDFANQRIIREQHRNQRNQENRQTGEADNGNGQRIDFDCAGRRAAQETQ